MDCLARIDGFILRAQLAYGVDVAGNQARVPDIPADRRQRDHQHRGLDKIRSGQNRYHKGSSGRDLPLIPVLRPEVYVL